MSGQSFGNQFPNQVINLLQRQNLNQQFEMNRQPPSLLNQQIPTAMPQPAFEPRVPNVNNEPRNPLYPFGNTGGPRTSPFTNQPLNPLRPSPSMPFNGLPQSMPQPTFTPSTGMPFGGVGGRPFASQQTPEDFQRMQDYYAQDAINQGIRANQGMPMGGAQQPAPIAMPVRGKR